MTMAGAGKTTLFWACLLPAFTGVRAAEDVGVIAASVIAGLLLLIFFVALTLYCFYKQGAFSEKKKKPKTKKPHHHHSNGYYHAHHKKSHYHANGFATTNLPPRMVETRVIEPPPPLPPPQPMYPYATYSGPPPEVRNAYEYKHGTFSGPPPVAIIPTQFGSVAVRPDPRPVVHSKKYKKRQQSPRRGERPQQEVQEYVVQPSYDGIPIVRPVIYVDDKKDVARHRSKSRDRKSRSKESSSSEQRVIEIKMATPPNVRTSRREEPEPEPMPAPDPKMAVYTAGNASPTPQPKTTPHRSRASSVTEAVNALRMSVQDHIDDDGDTSSSSSSRPVSPRFTVDRRSAKPPAPDPVAGDVMFFPAGQPVETERHIPAPSTSYAEYGYSKSIRTSDRQEPEEPPRTSDDPTSASTNEAPDPHVEKPKDEIYSYSRVIRQSVKQPAAPVVSATVNQGYEVPAQLRQSTRDENTYETEHGRQSTKYQDIGASMSDRITHMVEDGDKTRVTHYNVGAMNFGPDEAEEPVQMRRTRPRTPPVDIPRSSLIYSRPHRPQTPPNDIPLITPRESTEIPPLNLRSSTTSPRDQAMTGRPATPPQDFPITPQSSIVRPRPPTPPFDATTARSTVAEPVPADTARSAPVDPSTGEPGSFQARQKFIEAHLIKNVAGNTPADKTASAQFNRKSEAASKLDPARTEEKIDTAPPVSFPPGVIPPAPPPPPLPK